MIEDIFSRDKTVKEAIKNCYNSLPYRIENLLNQKERTLWILTDYRRCIYSYVYVIDIYSLPQKKRVGISIWE
jgi:hypothetical protein